MTVYNVCIRVIHGGDLVDKNVFSIASIDADKAVAGAKKESAELYKSDKKTKYTHVLYSVEPVVVIDKIY